MKAAKEVLSIDQMVAGFTPVEYAEVEVIGSVVRIASLSAADVIEFNESNEGPAKRTASIRLMVKSLVDKDGARIGKEEHVQQFMQTRSKEVTAIVDAVLTLNGLNKKNAEGKTDQGVSEAKNG